MMVEVKLGDPERHFPGKTKKCWNTWSLCLTSPLLPHSLSFGCMIGNLMWVLRVQSVYVKISVMNIIPVTKLALHRTCKLSVPLLLHLQNGLTVLIA